MPVGAARPSTAERRSKLERIWMETNMADDLGWIKSELLHPDTIVLRLTDHRRRIALLGEIVWLEGLSTIARNSKPLVSLIIIFK